MLNYLDETVKLLKRIEDYINSKLITDFAEPKNHFFLVLSTNRIGLDFNPNSLYMVNDNNEIDKDEVNYLFEVLKSIFLCSKINTAYIEPDTAFVYMNLEDIDFKILGMEDEEFELWKKVSRYKK